MTPADLIDTITCADCMDILPLLPDGFADVLLTDPPYGIGADGGVGGFGSAAPRKYAAGWDAVRPHKSVFTEMLRVSVNQIIFGGNYFADLLQPSGSWIVWDKVGEIPFQAPYADVELVWTNYRRASKKITCIQHGYIAEDKSPRLHPTQKPLPLICRILEEYTKPGDLILDPYSGSGTTACACHLLGRHFIAIERDPVYHAASLKRLADLRHQSLLDLNPPPPPHQAEFHEIVNRQS